MLKMFAMSQRQNLAQIGKPFVLQEGVLYRFGHNKFHRILQPKHVPIVLQELHRGVTRG
jgi:hypothetical protein